MDTSASRTLRTLSVTAWPTAEALWYNRRSVETAVRAHVRLELPDLKNKNKKFTFVQKHAHSQNSTMCSFKVPRIQNLSLIIYIEVWATKDLLTHSSFAFHFEKDFSIKLI